MTLNSSTINTCTNGVYVGHSGIVNNYNNTSTFSSCTNNMVQQPRPELDLIASFANVPAIRLSTATFGGNVNLDFDGPSSNGLKASSQSLIARARISQLDLGSWSAGMSFSTMVDGTSGLTEKMRINNNGNVGIGTSSPTHKLEVVGPSGGNSGLFL